MKQREEDFVSDMFVGSSHDHVLFFTNRGIMFDLRCFEIPMGGRDSRGTNIINLLPLTENEKIAAMMKVSEFNDESYIVIVTKNGKIKRTPLPSYKNVRKNGIIAIKLEEGDEIAGVGGALVDLLRQPGQQRVLEDAPLRIGQQRLLLPAPVRAVWTVWNGAPYMAAGFRDLLQKKA